MTSLPFRLVRATAFAAVSTGLGLLAHLFAAPGGSPIAPPAVLAGAAGCLAAAFCTAGRERGLGATLALMAGSQVLLHLLLSLSHEGAVLAAGGHPHAGLVPGLGMLVMHGWAVALTALWLARGEALLWALLRRLAVRLRLTLPVALAVPSWARAPHPAPRVLRSAVLRHAISGRAPPVFS
ncbi:MFS transporter [Nonomuraea sp. NPDC050310]|uniref:MFS transporter n=1 Tax=unclassified Nonomuraea TaxID=2593643 RepID=UPI003401F939